MSEKWQQWEEQGREFLDSLSREAKNAGVHTEFTQTWGEPGRDICELAQTWPAEIIFIGSRGLTGLKEMFMGSVSNYVTHHAPCSVLIVRENEDVNLDSQSSLSSSRSAYSSNLVSMEKSRPCSRAVLAIERSRTVRS